MASSDWRSSLAFSARLLAVNKITSAYQSSNPSLSVADARKEATLAEAKFYGDAQSSVQSMRPRNTLSTFVTISRTTMIGFATRR
ncbi:hypothetical protein BDW02DRAFT_565243 [Decorospora gaudefroyi]|uniref:Uncharacterized protein n=1 Tax=Decorospora gaudefroyi TaxID=184978 RepID=A0A6A5KIL5_9PLEO|nr:hypothetical protein BDW02DRAFT_565243 [Decorospora gaudefroyi]